MKLLNLIKKSILVCLGVATGLLAQEMPVAVEKEFMVTIIYTEGGGGHKAVMLAFEEALKNYPNRPKNIRINFHKVDPPMSSVPGQLATRYWDECFQNAHYDLLAPGMFAKEAVENSIFPAVAAVDHYIQVGKHTTLLPTENLIMKEGKPDMIISVINSGNASYLAVAQKYKIPFRIGLTDYKIDSFIDGIGHYGSKYTRNELEVYVPSDAIEVTQTLEKRNIPYVVTGYPINPKLNKMATDLRNRNPETIAAIKELLGKYEVKENDPVLFVMMGAKGFDMQATMKYIETIKKNARTLHKEGQKLHLFLAAGQNDELRNFGRDLAVSNNSDFVIHPLNNLTVDQVAAFMGIYQVGNPFLLFTKPGGSTTGQAEAMGTPTLYSLNPIEHERFNAELMKRKNYADTIDMVNRSKTLHPQKALELTGALVDQQVKNIDHVAKQAVNNFIPAPFKAVGSFWPFQAIGQSVAQVSQNIGNAVAGTVDNVGKTMNEKLPHAITNQNVVDEEGLVKTLHKYLVEGKKFSSPPANRFAEIVAPIIYRDLTKEEVKSNSRYVSETEKD